MYENSFTDYERRREMKRDFSTIGFALVLLSVISLAGQFAASGIYSLLIETGVVSKNSSIAYQIYYWCAAVVPMYAVGVPVFLKMLRRKEDSAPAKSNPGAGTVLIAFLAALGCMYAGNLIGNYLMKIINLIPGTDSENPVNTMLSGSYYVISALVTVVIAPVFEELMFRKTLCDRLSRYGGKVAIFWPALLFGLFHGNVFQVFYTFGLGLVLGYIYMQTGKLRYTIIIHSAINFLCGILPSILLDRIPDELFEAENAAEYFEEHSEVILPYILYSLYSIGFLLCGIAGVVVFIIYARKIKLAPARVEIPAGKADIMAVNAGSITMFAVLALTFVLNLLL